MRVAEFDFHSPQEWFSRRFHQAPSVAQPAMLPPQLVQFTEKTLLDDENNIEFHLNTLNSNTHQLSKSIFPRPQPITSAKLQLNLVKYNFQKHFTTFHLYFLKFSCNIATPPPSRPYDLPRPNPPTSSHRSCKTGKSVAWLNAVRRRAWDVTDAPHSLEWGYYHRVRSLYSWGLPHLPDDIRSWHPHHIIFLFSFLQITFHIRSNPPSLIATASIFISQSKISAIMLAKCRNSVEHLFSLVASMKCSLSMVK